MLDGWVTTMEPEHAIDFEVGNHFMSSHPDSPMMRHLMVCVRQDRGRLTLMNQDLTVRDGDATTRSRIADRGALRRLLAHALGTDLPDVERMRVPSIAEWR